MRQVILPIYQQGAAIEWGGVRRQKMRARGSIDVGLGAQKDCDHIILLSPYNQHHHRPHGRILVDKQWNCDRIIFLSETGLK